MKKLILLLIVLCGSQIVLADTTEVMSCSTAVDNVKHFYIKVSIIKEGANFSVEASAYNRTSKDIVETFIKTKLDGCEFVYTQSAGKYFSCYKFDEKTGMKTFKISNVYILENTLETLRYDLPRKSYRIEIATAAGDKSIDTNMYKEIIGNQNFLSVADCQ